MKTRVENSFTEELDKVLEQIKQNADNLDYIDLQELRKKYINERPIPSGYYREGS